MRTVQLELLRPGEILAERERCSIVYLPVGPLEWHGPAMPYGTDALLAQSLARCAAERTGGVVMPTLFIGTERERPASILRDKGFENPEQLYVLGMDVPKNSMKSFYAREDMFAVIVREHLRLLVQQGYRLIVIVNGHGAWGQTSTLERLAVEFSNETPSKVIVGFPTIAREGETIDFGHACDVETSLMQYLTDGCVDLSQLPPRDVKLKYTDWGIADDCVFTGHPPADKCVVRDPRAAAPEKGEQFFQVALEHLIWLSDGRTESAAALDFGIRIVHLSCAGKPNLFYRQPDDLSDGLATEAGWRIYGGHRFWSSPESTRSYYPDNAPVACELLADGVCLRQRTDPWTGFEKTLILRFLPDGRLSAEHILTNRNPQTVQAAAWGVCTLRGGGTARIPFPGGTAGEYTPGRVLSLWGQTSLADERLQFGPEEICARHLPRGTSLKLGVYTAKGKITAENLGQRLTVSCEVHPIAQCADHGCNVELYLNPDVMELETLGVLARLAPGQSTHHTEFWTLEPLSEG